MAKAEATVSVRIEISNYDELLRVYHALGNLLMAYDRPTDQDEYPTTESTDQDHTNGGQ